MNKESELLINLIAAFDVLLAAAIDYTEYEHDGDPYKEDARDMKEMDAGVFVKSEEIATSWNDSVRSTVTTSKVFLPSEVLSLR